MSYTQFEKIKLSYQHGQMCFQIVCSVDGVKQIKYASYDLDEVNKFLRKQFNIGPNAKRAITSANFKCSECGEDMQYDYENDILVCRNCNRSTEYNLEAEKNTVEILMKSGKTIYVETNLTFDEYFHFVISRNDNIKNPFIQIKDAEDHLRILNTLEIADIRFFNNQPTIVEEDIK